MKVEETFGQIIMSSRDPTAALDQSVEEIKPSLFQRQRTYQHAQEGDRDSKSKHSSNKDNKRGNSSSAVQRK